MKYLFIYFKLEGKNISREKGREVDSVIGHREVLDYGSYDLLEGLTEGI